ncbi:MAG: hypothetical protein NT008_06385 [Methylococcales bacterium]|nr:hypothetical protein [Methylococcales bacterium]
MAVSSPYAKHYPALIAGLINYRVRGYKIALKFDYVAQEEQSFDLITQLTPNFVSLSARSLDQLRDNALADKLRHLNARVEIAGGKSMLQQIDQQSSALLAENTGFNFVQGAYYENLAIQEAA